MRHIDVKRTVIIVCLVSLTLIVAGVAITDNTENLIYVALGLLAGGVVLWLDHGHRRNGHRPRHGR